MKREAEKNIDRVVKAVEKMLECKIELKGLYVEPGANGETMKIVFNRKEK